RVELAKSCSSIIASPKVKMRSSRSCVNDSETDPYGPNRNELFVPLNDYSTWKSGKVKADLVEELAKKLHDSIPGAFFSFTQPIIDNVTEAVTGSPADLAVIISGPDLSQLRKFANQTLNMIQTVPGAADY